MPNALELAVDRRLDVLQDTRYEQPLQRGRTYLLFLQSQPGHPWRVFCPYRTLAEVSGDRVTRVNLDIEPLWSKDTVEAIQEEVKVVLPSP